jgi:hypothetical protein
MFVCEKTYVCDSCCAVASNDVMIRVPFSRRGSVCPFCNNKPRYNFKNSLDTPNGLKKIYDVFNNGFRGHVVDAVFFESNGVSSPRLVVRFVSDRFFGDNKTHKRLPKEFIYTRKRSEKNVSMPIEAVYYFDVEIANNEDKFHAKANQVVANLYWWAFYLVM